MHLGFSHFKVCVVTVSIYLRHSCPQFLPFNVTPSPASYQDQHATAIQSWLGNKIIIHPDSNSRNCSKVLDMHLPFSICHASVQALICSSVVYHHSWATNVTHPAWQHRPGHATTTYARDVSYVYTKSALAPGILSPFVSGQYLENTSHKYFLNSSHDISCAFLQLFNFASATNHKLSISM